MYIVLDWKYPKRKYMWISQRFEFDLNHFTGSFASFRCINLHFVLMIVAVQIYVT